MRRDSAPSREAWEDTAETLASHTGAGGFPGTDEACSGYVRAVARTLLVKPNDSFSEDLDNYVAIPSTGDVSHCLNAGGVGRQDYETETLITQPRGVTVHGTCGTVSVASYDDVAQCLRARTPGNIDNSSTTVVQQPMAIPLLEIGKRAGPAADDPRAGIGIGTDGDPMFTLQAGAQHGVAVEGVASPIAYMPARTLAADGGVDERFAERDVCDALHTASGHGNKAPVVVVHGTQDPCVSAELAFALGRNNGGENAVCVTGDVTHTLKAEGFDASEDGTGRGQPIVASVALRGRDGGATAELGNDVARCLRASGGGGDKAHALVDMAVRRLTPVECERLQGFPDGYTSIPWDGWRAMDASETPESCIAGGMEIRQTKKTGKWRVKDVDRPRYKALGNSMAVPCMAWLGLRIQQYLNGELKRGFL